MREIQRYHNILDRVHIERGSGGLGFKLLCALIRTESLALACGFEQRKPPTIAGSMLQETKRKASDRTWFCLTMCGMTISNNTRLVEKKNIFCLTHFVSAAASQKNPRSWGQTTAFLCGSGPGPGLWMLHGGCPLLPGQAKCKKTQWFPK